MSGKRIRNLMGMLIVPAVGSALAFGTAANAASVTGDPSVDSGWILGGNSFDKGVYVQGSGTFSYDIYSASFTLDAVGHSAIINSFTGAGLDWLAGDRIVGLGGKFVGNTIANTGWDAGEWEWKPYSGGGEAFNDDVSGSSNPQAKFGTSAATWSPSTVAPLNGNGSGSTGDGGFGAIHMRTQISFGNRTDAGNGIPDLPDLLRRVDGLGSAVTMDNEFGRLVYIADGQVPESWQWLLNIDLLERNFAGDPTPLPGDLAIASVQRGTNRFTDGLINVVPEPTSLALLAVGGLVLLRRRHGG
ncbi:MAG: PEP-CTERM sorting domain-containing protein [Phycisphaeraceae bacterium]|nr:PEP-CTERM sorting domain-containing protein [Phycisphaeraceae bacterium]